MWHNGTIHAKTTHKRDPRLTLQETRVPEAKETSKMFCRGCAYNLFSLTNNQCPECGRPFDPNNVSTFYGNAHPPKLWPSKLGIIVAVYPILVVLAIYIAWIAGRFELGHWPRPYSNDPANISGSVDVFVAVARILFVLPILPFLLYAFFIGPLLEKWGLHGIALALFLIGIGYLGVRWVLKRRSSRRFWLLLMMIGITWGGSLLFLIAWDPLCVFRWFVAD